MVALWGPAVAMPHPHARPEYPPDKRVRSRQATKALSSSGHAVTHKFIVD
jgi:hypothetical protein